MDLYEGVDSNITVPTPLYIKIATWPNSFVKVNRNGKAQMTPYPHFGSANG